MKLRINQSRATVRAFFAGLAVMAGAVPLRAADVPVTLTQDGQSFTLSNGYLSAVVNKRSGDLTNLFFQDKDLMGHVSGHHAGYWEQSPTNAVTAVTLDPAKNGGERAEVSVKGLAAGGVGGGNNGGVMLEIRYSLGRGEHGAYTYAIFSKAADGAAGSIGESRFGAKLNAGIFDWLSVDVTRNSKMPTGKDWDAGTATNMKEARRLTTGEFKGRVEHKYDYSATQFDIPAFGWASSTQNIGLYFINPSMEFLSGGPTHVELTCHLDDGDGGDPTMLDYWRGTHYGSTELQIGAGEAWSKVVGPIMIYVNSGDVPGNLFKDALKQAEKESAAWPYGWVEGVDYPHKEQRGTAKGKFILNDPLGPSPAVSKLPHLLVGLTAPDAAANARGGRVGGLAADWQHDAKHYQFWARGNDDGTFTIPNIRPGAYTLRALADGVLGEFSQANITIDAGRTLDLAGITWSPVRYGRQLWDIGIPNRNATEFASGNDHWHWGEYLHYAELFPNDVQFVVGKSDYAKDWFFEQVPHTTSPADTLAAGTGTSRGRATPWTITFNVADPVKGRAILRAAICGAGTNHVDVTLNNQPVGQLANIMSNSVINRDGAQGSWVERDLPFDAALLKKGDNTLTLTVPAGSLTSGILYDYLRLEIAE